MRRVFDDQGWIVNDCFWQGSLMIAAFGHTPLMSLIHLVLSRIIRKICESLGTNSGIHYSYLFIFKKLLEIFGIPIRSCFKNQILSVFSIQSNFTIRDNTSLIKHHNPKPRLSSRQCIIRSHNIPEGLNNSV